MGRTSRRPPPDPAAEAFDRGWWLAASHPLLAPLARRAQLVRRKGDTAVSRGDWAVVTSNGVIHCQAARPGEPPEWAYVLAHCLLHLGMGHVAPAASRRSAEAWNGACDRAVELFLGRLKVGRRPPEYAAVLDGLPREELAAYRQLLDEPLAHGVPRDLAFETLLQWRRIDWSAVLAEGVRNALDHALARASGRVDARGRARPTSAVARAHQWFMNSFPLMGALASSFELVEDREICQAMGIRVAAVGPSQQTIYFNPLAGLTEAETRFVMAHEILHVALRHEQRCKDRDPYLWNCAADFAINLWLVELGIGEVPSLGVLLDPSLKGLPAEDIYDRVAKDLRRLRRLATFAGTGMGDMLGPGGWWESGEGAALEDFYRSALAQGLDAYQEHGPPGLLPAGLEEEIRAQMQPPIPWDVQLSDWFDSFFAPIETRRSYARPSRRQSATPDIPRPRAVPTDTALDGRTFGVVLDTSGSMNRVLLARALGAISSYASSRDVPAVRVVFCDARAYDAGYMEPSSIAGRVQVKGRGGTVLQPGVDLLQAAEDFPSDGPILVITDTMMSDGRLRFSHEHAYLVPRGRRLPFPSRAPVFELDARIEGG